MAIFGLSLSIGTAQVTLSNGHADIGIAYENHSWNLHVHDEVNDIEYAPSEALFHIGINTLTRIPASPSFAFLGNAGSPVYVLPQVQKADQVFLGLGTEEMDPVDWASPVTLKLKGVSGPGSLAVWDTDAFGKPVPLLNSSALTGNGVEDSDSLTLTPGGHRHLNWAFTALGDYSVTFEASGIHALDGSTRSGDVTYAFSVVPEPGTIGLLASGLALMALSLFRNRNRRSFWASKSH
jgi:surface-anchored protein